MAARKLIGRLVDKQEIKEELFLISGSQTDYITKTGKIYKDYGENKFYPKKNFLNHGYWYCNITYPEGIKTKRVHRLLAQMFIPNPFNYPIVLHIDSNKRNMALNNLKWGTVSENTLQASREGALKNDKGWEDSQSIPVCQFDLNGSLIEKFGSVGEASRKFGLTKTAILYQCKHKVRTIPRCGFWFRYLSEFEKEGFVL